jgi:hypothetical protein
MSNEQAHPESTEESMPTSHADMILSTLQNSVKFVIDLDKDPNRTKPITDGLAAFVKARMPAPPGGPVDNKCSKPDPITIQLCSQLSFNLAKEEMIFAGAASGAASYLHVAVLGWSLAVNQFRFNTQTPLATLDAAVEMADAAYKAALKAKPGSQSRALVLWYQLEAAVLAATEAYESSLAAAASTLAGEAGTLQAEYATYVAAINGAAMTHFSSIRAANQTFWQGVEAPRD